MAEFVDYKEVPFVDKNYWKVESGLVRDGIGWNYEIKVDKEGTKPTEKHGLYDLYIENHIDIPDGISKDSPCYKQFMKEKERM